MKKDEDSDWEIVDEIPTKKKDDRPQPEKKIIINPSAVKVAGAIAIVLFLLVITKGRLYSLWWFYLAIGIWWLYRMQTKSGKKK